MSAVPRRLNTGREVFAAIAGAWRLGRIDRTARLGTQATTPRDIAHQTLQGQLRAFQPRQRSSRTACATPAAASSQPAAACAAAACATFAIRHQRPASPEQFISACQQAWQRNAPTVVEVQVAAGQTASQLQALAAQITTAALLEP